MEKTYNHAGYISNLQGILEPYIGEKPTDEIIYKAAEAVFRVFLILEATVKTQESPYEKDLQNNGNVKPPTLKPSRIQRILGLQNIYDILNSIITKINSQILTSANREQDTYKTMLHYRQRLIYRQILKYYKNECTVREVGIEVYKALNYIYERLTSKIDKQHVNQELVTQVIQQHTESLFQVLIPNNEQTIRNKLETYNVKQLLLFLEGIFNGSEQEKPFYQLRKKYIEVSCYTDNSQPEKTNKEQNEKETLNSLVALCIKHSENS